MTDELDEVRVRVTRLENGRGLPLPLGATAGSAGSDLSAAIDESVVLAPGKSALVPTGFAVEIPRGWEAQVRPRSGLALRHGVTVLNSPGTIDSDYRGEVAVVLINHGIEPFHIARGDRIAQMVISRVPSVEWVEAESLAESERGEGGFGSTGR
jgi:dUTP pyrophosphatase